jgi:hypothetical protein
MRPQTSSSKSSSVMLALCTCPVRTSRAVSNTALSITCSAMKTRAVSAMTNIRKKKAGAMMANSMAAEPSWSRARRAAAPRRPILQNRDPAG